MIEIGQVVRKGPKSFIKQQLIFFYIRIMFLKTELKN